MEKRIFYAIAAFLLIAAVTSASAGVDASLLENAPDVQNPNMTIKGKLNIIGSTTILPVTKAAKVEFVKIYPLVKIKTSGGGSEYGRYKAYTTTKKKVIIGASSSIWPGTDQIFNGTLVPNRSKAIIQEGDMNATVFETKIGTSMIVVAANLGADVTGIDIVNTAPVCESRFAPPTAAICFNDLRDAYDGKPPASFEGIKVVQRKDASGTEETFAKWIGLADPATGQLMSNATGKKGNEKIRDYINSTTNTIGFVDIGFTKGRANGAENVIAAMMNGTSADASTKGVGNAYDNASAGLTYTGKGLARDLFYYNNGQPNGVMKTYLDWITSPDGQDVVLKAGFFSI